VASTVQQSRRTRYEPGAGSVAAARRFVRRVLADWGADELVEDAQLLVSELATNAVVHAGTSFEVACADVGDAVRLEVCDGYPARGLPATPAAVGRTAASGRGLLMCAALSSAWGVEYTRTTKTVWCRLDLAGRGSVATTPTEDLPAEPVMVAVVGTSGDGAIEDWNADAEALLGWSAGAARGRPLVALTLDGTLPADLDRPSWPAADSAAGAVDGGPRRWQGELTLRRADGAAVPLYAVRQPGRDRTGGRRATWLLVNVAQRAALASAPAAAEQAGATGWVAFSEAELVRLRFDDVLQRAADRACDAFEADAAYLLLTGVDGTEPRLATSGLPGSSRAPVFALPADHPAPRPAYEPASGPASGPAPRPASRPVPEPASGPASRAVDEPASGPASGPAPQPALRLAPQPAPEPASLAVGGLPAVHDDLPETAPIPLLVGSGLCSAIVAPLLAEGRPIGQMCVASARRRHFGKDDAARLQQAADRLALALDTRQVAELIRRHRDHLAYLAEASDLLAGTLDPQMTLAMLAQLLVPRLAQWCVLWVQDARGVPMLSYVWHADERRLDAIRAAVGGLIAATADPAHPAAAGDPFQVPGLGGGVSDLGGDRAAALPLRARGRVLGTAVLGRPADDWFSRDALDLARELSRRAALALDNALLYRAQLATTRALQRSLLPAALPAVPGLEIGVAYEAAGEGLDAGGDFYDVFPVDERRWRFAVGDVSGAGPEAAGVTGLARHTLHLLARLDRPLAEAVAQLNQAILDQEAKARFLTAVHGEITLRPAGGIRLALVVAGHPPPYLLEPGGRVRTVGTPGPLLGVLDQVDHRADVVLLAPGDALVCVTDGVLERRNAGRTLGEDDLPGLLASCAGLSATATATTLRRAVVEYAPLPPRDDLAVLVLRAVTAPPAEPGPPL